LRFSPHKEVAFRILTFLARARDEIGSEERGVRNFGSMALVAGLVAGCQQAQPPSVEVEQAWSRDTVGRTATAAVFMTITSEEGDRLLGGSTVAAGETDLMTMTMDGGAMAMEYVEGIDLPAGQPVSLDPSGLHVWLEDLETPLEAGRSFPLTLRFEKAGEQEIEVSVVPPGGEPPSAMKM